jgi:hypothetical protein
MPSNVPRYASSSFFVNAGALRRYVTPVNTADQSSRKMAFQTRAFLL